MTALDVDVIYLHLFIYFSVHEYARSWIIGVIDSFILGSVRSLNANPQAQTGTELFVIPLTA